MRTSTFIVLISIAIFCTLACKKSKKDPRIPPDVSFKSASGFITGDCVLTKQDTVWVGINATKTEDDLKSYNVSYAFDGATSTTTFYNYYLNSNEYEHYSKDIQIITRNQAGSERWVFTILDRDGNITQKTINITVQ